MENELPKKTIKRATVPPVSKELASKALNETEGTVAQNVVLFMLFIVVSAIVYMAIFQKEMLSNYTSSSYSNKILTPQDSTGQNEEETLVKEEDTNVIGQASNGNGALTSPTGSRFYLIVGTYIFYPYAEKCVTRMTEAGYNASIISTGDARKFHRVYIESSEDGNSIRAKRDQLIRSSGLKVWVYTE